MDEKLNMVVSLRVEGKEGLNLELKYENTNIKTILLVEKAILDTFAGLLEKQQRGQI